MRCLIFIMVLACSTSTAWADEGDKVLATFEDGSITYKEFADRNPTLVSWLGITAKSEQVETAIEDMILDHLMGREAQHSGIADKPEVALQINKVLAGAYLRERVPRDKIVIDEATLLNYYKKHHDEYKLPETAEISHILLASLADAKQVKETIKQGKSFAEMAKLKSLDSISAKQGGKLGVLDLSRLLPELSSAVNDLSPGQISQPIESDFGYHLLLIDSEPTKGYKSYEEVKKELYQKAVRETEISQVEAIKKELWRKYDVSLAHEPINEIVESRGGANVSGVTIEKTAGKKEKGVTPELKVISESINLGTIGKQKASHKISIKNTSNHKIDLIRIGSNCPCATAKAEPVSLAPGEVGQITYVYDPDMYKEQGIKEKALVVDSTDRIQPRKNLKITANIIGG